MPVKNEALAGRREGFRLRGDGGGPLLTCPLHVIAAFYMPRPKGHRNSKGMIKGSAQPYPTSRPDLLKVARAIEDAMSGVIYCDDSQIVIEHLTKKYEEHRGPGVEIKVGKIVE